MEEKQKNQVMVGVLALSALFLITSIGSCHNAFRQQKAKDKEILTRMELEEKLNQYTQQGEQMKAELEAAQAALTAEKSSHQATKTALAQEQMINKSLKEEVQKISKLNDALEQDLKKIMTTGRK